MTAELTPQAGPAPRRARQLIPAALPRRGELVAACAVAVVLTHLLLAQLTIVLAVVFAVTGRVTRWRTWWLIGPAAAGLAWTLAIGPDRALADFAAAPASILAHLGAGRAARGGGPAGAFSGLGGLLPRQLPVALPLAAAEAAVASWLAWLHTDEWAVPPPRPGFVAALRTAVAARAVRSGAVVTRDGCALGVVPATGAVAELRWAEIARGALVAGADQREVTLAALQVVHAALRRRRPLIVLADAADTAIARALAAACQATGTPLLPGGPRDAEAVPGLRRPGPHQSSHRRSSLGQSGPGEAAPGEDGTTRTDLTPVISQRAAVLLPAGTPARAASACADVAALAAHLRAIGVDGDALVWVPRAELLPPRGLAALLRDGGAAGLPVLTGTTSPAVAARLADLAGTTLIARVADPGMAAGLAARSGTRLVPPPVAAALAGEPAGASGVPRPAASVGQRETADLVPGPVTPARSLLALGEGEFVLTVRGPRPRRIALGRLEPARLPRLAARAGAAP